ncbi:uncharacterized protein LOC129945266 [Eupeodes corollae]|uniref:uncharacterized protein LOC129945266 n=1 Tax=Eupeodes corollae TaxID=290404 RepID=UPI002492B36A|nr:uncharacterized protein LOC129945266 [Eupeodes corollae]
MELSARSAYRGQVTKIVKNATDFFDNESSQLNSTNDLDTIEEEIVQFVQRLTLAHESLNAVNKDVQTKGLLKTDELDREFERVSEYEDSAIGVLSRLNSRLQKVRNKLNPPTNNTSRSPLNNSSSHNNNSNYSVKLPKLQLKKFDGNYHEWLSFWEQFRTAVHENGNLTSSDKFSYLESVLTGSAKNVIGGFTASGMCYEAAISLLQEQFGDVERLVDKNMQQLLSLRSVHQRTDAASLRNLYNSITSCCRTLTALQIPTHHYHVMLKTILLRCLPSELRVDYYRVEERDEQEHATETKEDDDSSSTTSLQIGDKQVKDIMRFLKREVESLERKNGQRYQASLPWKHPDVVVKSNKAQALTRLKSLRTRLSRHPEQYQQYDAGIQQLLQDGVAEPIPPPNDGDLRRVIYLPHRPVYKAESTTTKIRIVFDASARSEFSPSLNDLLHVGANLLPDVLKILLNFRLGRYGIVADVEKAFLQIELNKKDRDSHRFLWYNTEEGIAEYRMTRVTFGVNCSPFLLTATLRFHLKNEIQFQPTCNILMNSFYMDDFAASCNTEEEGKRIGEEAVLVMRNASMNLRKWNSNSELVRNALCPDASMKAYGTVAFIKIVGDDGEESVAFLCAKNRVAPLKIDGIKELSLPKLELTAALLAARLCAYLKQSLKVMIHKFFLWTDSRIALGWIQGDANLWKPYVQSRVTEIRHLTSVADWRHCKGKENPADLLTRGVTAY